MKAQSIELRLDRPVGPGMEVVVRGPNDGAPLTEHDVATVRRMSRYGRFATVKTADGRLVNIAVARLRRVFARCTECNAPLIHGPSSEDRTGLCTVCYVSALYGERR